MRSYHKCYGIDFIITRFSNVYGMYDDSNRLIPLFIRQSREGKNLVIYGEDKLLDFTYIDDTVNGIINCIEKFDDAKNNVFNIATGKGATIIEVAGLIKKYLHSENKIIIDSNRTGEVVKFIADISEARRNLGFAPKIELSEGIKNSLQWYSGEPDEQ